MGPILAANSERIGAVILGTKNKRAANEERDRMRAETIALVEDSAPPRPLDPEY